MSAKESAALKELKLKLFRLKQENRSLKLELEVDELTGLYNSRSFKLRLKQALANLSEKGQRPALLFLDVDHFKLINETHGHRAAGHLLRQVGKLIDCRIREGDVAFRYGGDEFVILVSGGKRGALSAGERIRKAIETHDFRVEGLNGLAQVRLTVSVGMHVMAPGDTADQILDRADKAMYEAKKRSRNTVVSSAA